MILYSIFKARNPGLTDKEICEQCGLDSQLPGRWARKYGAWFTDWLDEALDFETGADDAAVLERVGMIQATQAGNYQYWRDMARQKGVIKDEIKEATININTDFTAILNMGDLDAARSRLLQELRGVALPGGPGMVDVTPARQHQGPGAGASQLQARPLEMANALGPDRRRPEQGKSIPAVPEQDTFTSTYEVLDDGEVSPGAQISPDDLHMAVRSSVPTRLDVLTVEDDDLSV